MQALQQSTSLAGGALVVWRLRARFLTAATSTAVAAPRAASEHPVLYCSSTQVAEDMKRMLANWDPSDPTR